MSGFGSATRDIPETSVKPDEMERRRSGIPPLQINAPTKGGEYAKVFYKGSNTVYGKKQEVSDLVPPRHGLSNRFSNHLASAGMWRKNGLNSYVDPPRFMNGTTDWMLKNS